MGDDTTSRDYFDYPQDARNNAPSTSPYLSDTSGTGTDLRAGDADAAWWRLSAWMSGNSEAYNGLDVCRADHAGYSRFLDDIRAIRNGAPRDAALRAENERLRAELRRANDAARFPHWAGGGSSAP